jgi:hypothetical protein
MYIARTPSGHTVKKMPFTGWHHASSCDHYEPPAELSGYGQVAGSAIREDEATACTTLAVDFALVKGAARAAPTFTNVEHESVRSDGTKLTLRALLHYLYDQANLTRWSPRMAGKRSWYIVRRELLAAASDKRTKGQSLSDLVFIPESFDAKDVQGIAQRRLQTLTRLASSARNRMLIVAPLKHFEPARFGHKCVLKHLPDMPLHVDEDLHKRITRRFANQLAAWGHLPSTQMLLVGTISQPQQGLTRLEEACLMNVHDSWIPFDGLLEHELIDALVRSERRFVKGLHYNLPSTKPLASVILQDVGEVPCGMYLIGAGVAPAFEQEAADLAAASKIQAWWWRTGQEALPKLPAVI